MMKKATSQTAYNLEQIETVCTQLNLRCERDPDEIRVLLAEARTLCFRNTTEGDWIAGILGAPWHFHGNLCLMTSSHDYVELDPPALLLSLRAGEILLLDIYHFDEYQDSRLVWHLEALDCRHMQAGEELRVRCLSFDDRPR